MSERDARTAAERYFGALLGTAVGLAAAVRLAYVFTDRPAFIGGDGYDYHYSALRLADGLGYTSALGDVGAQYAHHPPGWVTVLGVVSWLGGRTEQAHQLVGVAIGAGIVVLIGFVGRRYFTARIGIIAAVLAALYPGFWVLEAYILAEPLGLFVFGIFLLVIADMRDRPTIARSVALGAVCGLLALARSEQLLLLVIVAAPVLLRLDDIAPRQRATFAALAVLACAVVIAPWSIYNETRFRRTVILSTNGGGTLLGGNCPPNAYAGEHLGHYDVTCLRKLAAQHPGFDRSQIDPVARSAALDNISDNIGKLPRVVPARFGRALAVFRPSQTVGWTASWMNTDRHLIWAWVASYWLLLPLAAVGTVHAWGTRAFLIPLLGPVVIVLVTIAVSYGEPRSHTPSDLSIVVLAAVGIDYIASLRSARPPVVPANEGRSRLMLRTTPRQNGT